MTLSNHAPRMPVRTRLLRPDIFSDDVTGTLAPSTLLAYLGLSTRADDAGFLVWCPAAIGATLMPYASPGPRERALERIGAELVEAGLLRTFACGCAELPRLVRSKTYSVRDWHLAHVPPDSSVQVQTPTAESVSASGSSSGSRSESGSLSGPGSDDGSGAGPGRARGWSDPEWLERLHRLGMPMERLVDQTWSPWLASLQRRHADQTIFEAITKVVEHGETRPAVVQELVVVALEGPVWRRP
jgi:hypothetical protein